MSRDTQLTRERSHKACCQFHSFVAYHPFNTMEKLNYINCIGDLKSSENQRYTIHAKRLTSLIFFFFFKCEKPQSLATKCNLSLRFQNLPAPLGGIAVHSQPIPKLFKNAPFLTARLSTAINTKPNIFKVRLLCFWYNQPMKMLQLFLTRVYYSENSPNV